MPTDDVSGTGWRGAVGSGLVCSGEGLLVKPRELLKNLLLFGVCKKVLFVAGVKARRSVMRRERRKGRMVSEMPVRHMASIMSETLLGAASSVGKSVSFMMTRVSLAPFGRSKNFGSRRRFLRGQRGPQFPG